MTRPKGRPCKLNAETRTKLLEAIREGNTLSASCTRAGISYSTFTEWMRKGEAEKAGEFHDLAQDVRGSEAEAEANLVGMMRSAAKDDWRAAAHLLSCRSKDWVQRSKIDAKVDAEVRTGQIHLVHLRLIGDEETLFFSMRRERETMLPLIQAARDSAAAQGHRHDILASFDKMMELIRLDDRPPGGRKVMEDRP